MQTIDLVHFLSCGVGLALVAQRKPQVVMRFFEIGLQLDGALERRDGASRVAAGFEFLPKIELCSGIVGIDGYRFAELRKGASVIALSTQGHAQQHVCRCKLRIQLEGATKLSRSTREIA